MTDTIFIAVITGTFSVLGIIISALITNGVVKYRVEQLEKKVDLHAKKVTVTCYAKKNMMSLGIECSVNRTEPEDYIRDIRKIEKIGEGIVK